MIATCIVIKVSFSGHFRKQGSPEKKIHHLDDILWRMSFALKKKEISKTVGEFGKKRAHKFKISLKYGHYKILNGLSG